MEALNNKRLRLRHELQEAYGAWMDATARHARPVPARPVDISGAPGDAALQWFDYLAAKQRLVKAYAEMAPTKLATAG